MNFIKKLIRYNIQINLRKNTEDHNISVRIVDDAYNALNKKAKEFDITEFIEFCKQNPVEYKIENNTLSK